VSRRSLSGPSPRSDADSWQAGAANHTSFVQIMRERAEEHPKDEAFLFLGDDHLRLSYGELDRRARAVAAAIQACTQPGERVLLLYPPGPEYVVALFGCFYAGVVGVPAYPPDPTRLSRTLPRLHAIMDDARAAAVLTIGAIREVAGALLEDRFATTELLATDSEPTGMEDSWRDPEAQPDTLALLQYTSGSTRTPRGVMLSHANLLRNSEFIRRAFGHSLHSRGVIWLPPYHDMGLIGGVLQPIYAGFPCALMSPLTFLRRPLLWLRAISDYGGTTSGGPNFAFEMCVRRIAPEQREGLDLSSWDLAFNGSEPIRKDTLDAFADTFAPYGFRRESFYPCYGLAEATLMVTGGVKLQPLRALRVDAVMLDQERSATPSPDGMPAKTILGCGHPDREHSVLIVDPETQMSRAELEIGEIWVSGPSVARGYWNAPDDTAETFRATLLGGSQRYLRTGDLGFLADGELFVTGRAKDLVIVAGRNYYPLDIEQACEDVIGLRRNCGAAFAVEHDGRDGVALVYEFASDPSIDTDAVIGSIRKAVARDLQLQVHAVTLIEPRTIPKTSSGKVQRNLCRLQFLQGTLDAVAEWSLRTAGQGPVDAL
jgi:acyl-CoA synthetase (AMP-forming)/AMP-acid ligase II